MADLTRKRARHGVAEAAGSSPSSSTWSKVCIVCRGSSCWYDIYVVDLKKNVARGTLPLRLRIDGEVFTNAAFCILGYTLYAFEGYHSNGTVENKSAYTYELPHPEEEEKAQGGRDVMVTKSMLQELPTMNHHYKYFPIATPTPDGKKILLFSTIIMFKIPLENKCDFELYDPVTGEWRQLPGIPRPASSAENFRYDPLLFFSSIRVRNFSFPEPCVVMLRTDIGLCTLDLVHGQEWKWLPNFHGAAFGPKLSGTDHFVVVGDGLCLTPSEAYDVNEERDTDHADGGGGTILDRRSFDYPNLSHEVYGTKYRKTYAHIASLDENCSHFCILQVGVAASSNRVLMTLDVYRLDLVTSMEKLGRSTREREGALQPLPGTRLVKFLKFVVKDELDTLYFYPRSFSSIPPPSTF